MQPPPPDLCFVAAHAAGRLRLRLPQPPAGCTAVSAAVALDDCDGLLSALDEWMETELDWQWEMGPEMGPEMRPEMGPQCSPRPEQPPLPPATASGVIATANAAIHGRLEAPWQLLRKKPAPPTALAGCLQWDEAPALLTLCRLYLEPAEQAAIECGGAVVLPDSLRPDWLGWLHLPDEAPEQGLPVTLAGPVPDDTGDPNARGNSRSRGNQGAAGTPQPAPSEAGEFRLCQVRLAPYRPLPASLLAGWDDARAMLADLVDWPVELWIGPAADGGASRLLAQGRLLPWGHGWAMMIDQLN